MKRIILDHLKRWGWLWLVIGVANGFITGAFLDEKRGFDAFTFQVILWLGAMQLNFDLLRGISRALATLPLTARQIGRAWWLVSVALPALLLLVTSALALLVHCCHTGKPFPMDTFVVRETTSALFLGTMFSLFVGELPGWPQNVLGWLRRIFSVGLIFAIMFSNVANGTWMGIALHLTALFLTVIGWFRAEQMVVQRATFRPGIQLGKRTPGQHRAPSGFGGLPFLVQTQFIQFIRFALLFTAIMMLLPLIQGRSLNHSLPQMFHAALPALASFGGIFTFMFLMLPVLLQLRYLRTLPISVSALAALLVFIPVAPVLIAGTVFNLATGNFPSSENFLPFPIQCLTYAAAMTIAVPLLVCQGMRSGSFVVLVLGMVATMLAPVLFPWLKVPLPVSALISTGVLTLSFLLTRRLLKSSSRAYRPLPTTMSGWGGWR